MDQEKDIEVLVKRIDHVRELKSLLSVEEYDRIMKDLEDQIKQLKGGKQRVIVGSMKA